MRQMARILLVDDERDLVWTVRNSLIHEGYEIFTAHDGLEALNVARGHRPDLVILDVVMPRLDGLQVCSRMRQDPALATVPILFLTVRSAVEERIRGLDSGGDDYLAKPFDLRELRARIKALLRRSQLAPPKEDSESEGQGTLLVKGSLRLNLKTHRVRVEDKVMQLTPTEFDLLYHFVAHPGELFTSRQLLRHVWGYSPEVADPSLVRWHIKNLRTKIEPDPASPVYICTVPRQGYILAA